MANDFPLVLLPDPIDCPKASRYGGSSQLHFPNREIQNKRVSAMFKNLQEAISKKDISIHASPDGIEPEYALVFEVAGTLKSFYGTVNKIPGFEWIFDFDEEDIEPNEEFYALDSKGNKKPYSCRVYCIMSDKKAVEQLLSFWDYYQKDKNYGFERGYGSLKALFNQLANIRMWNTTDRLEETGIIDSWQESSEIAGDSKVTFEAELFFRSNEKQRKAASRRVEKIVNNIGGSIQEECVIEQIGYHGLLVSLPRNKIKSLLDQTEDVLEFVNCEDVMFFRPTGQLVSISEHNETFKTESFKEVGAPILPPVVALLDGMPIENHDALKERITLYDPDGFGNNYPVSSRKHGTAMASLIVHGDLQASSGETIKSKLYVRPVMQAYPYEEERFPKDKLFLDIIHRAVREICENDHDDNSACSHIKVINFSLGDPSRQYLRSGSPLAKLLDWLSFEYKVLFIVSAGNQELSLIPGIPTFEELKSLNLEKREEAIFRSVKSNSRNHHLLSPAESINSLTVGSSFEDATKFHDEYETSNSLLPVRIGSLSPISSFGPGMANAVKPDVIFPGGTFCIIDDGKKGIRPNLQPTREPGCKAACPGSGSRLQNYSYEFGTSISAALLSHEAALCHETLQDIFKTDDEQKKLADYEHVLLKAMLVHGISWSILNDNTEEIFNVKKNEIHKWIGYGKPNVSHARECAKNRITAIGCNEIGANEGLIFKLPLPLAFHTGGIQRTLTVTLAYMTPIAPNRKEYHKAQLFFDLAGDTKENLAQQRKMTGWQAFRRGTIQHEVFEGSSIFSWDIEDGCIEIVVSCSNTNDLSSLGKQKIPFALLVTFEATDENVDVYFPVINKLRTIVNESKTPVKIK